MGEEKGKSLTPKDVLKRIEEHGGTAEGLDLLEERFERGINLRRFNLKGIILKVAHLEGAYLEDAHLEGANLEDARLEKAKLWDAHLEEADLASAHLEKANLAHAHLEGVDLWNAHFDGTDLAHARLEGVDLYGAHFKGAHLEDAHLEGAYLRSAHLEGAYLRGAVFDDDTKLENVDWGNYILGEEKAGFFDSAVASYRHLKVWYTNAGYSDIAAKFYYREREASRKDAKHWYGRLELEILRVLFGYGERWRRVLISIAVLMLLFASIYLVISTFIPNFGTLTPNTFLHSLYYSVVSFTALGYGEWAPQPTGWIKGIGAFESLVGVSMLALLLVTFFRKWTR